MEEYITLIAIFLFVALVMNRIADSFDKKGPSIAYKVKKYINVKYYSNGVQLNQPFHIEYKFIVREIDREREYEMKYRKILKEYPNEPIFDVEIKLPIYRTYSYTYNHVKLARAYLKDKKNYLENLS